MGRHVVRAVGALGDDLALAPERWDPRRTVAVASAVCLAEIADVVTDNVQAAGFDARARVLVLDTSHAWEGFVVARHAPVPPQQLGSAKRALRPGDVIISRLRPYLRQVAFVDDALFALVPGGNAVVASTEFYVLRGKDGLDAACLVPYLLSTRVQAALAAGQEGGHHPRFERAQLEQLPVPRAVVTPRRARALAAEVRTLSRTLRAALIGGRELVDELDRRLARR